VSLVTNVMASAEGDEEGSEETRSRSWRDKVTVLLPTTRRQCQQRSQSLAEESVLCPSKDWFVVCSDRFNAVCCISSR